MKLHHFDRDIIIVLLVGALLFYLVYTLFPMQPPELKGY